MSIREEKMASVLLDIKKYFTIRHDTGKYGSHVELELLKRIDEVIEQNKGSDKKLR